MLLGILSCTCGELMLEKLRKKVAEKISPSEDRAKTTFDRLYKEAGFIPLLNMRDTESRLTYLRTQLEEQDFAVFDPKRQAEVVRKVYATFFLAGDAWYRGLNNRELAEKVACFLQNYTEVGYMEEFVPDLFEEAMQLLSLSWQEIDVTNTPFYIVESRPVVIPKLGGYPSDQVDETGMLEMKDELEKLRDERGKRGKS
jgi:hypothetical protein